MSARFNQSNRMTKSNRMEQKKKKEKLNIKTIIIYVHIEVHRRLFISFVCNTFKFTCYECCMKLNTILRLSEVDEKKSNDMPFRCVVYCLAKQMESIQCITMCISCHEQTVLSNAINSSMINVAYVQYTKRVEHQGKLKRKIHDFPSSLM